MAAPLSADLRGGMGVGVRGGSSRGAAAGGFAASPASAVRLMQRVAETGSVEPGQIGGQRRSPLDAHAATLPAIVAEKTDITLAGIRQEVQTRLRPMGGLAAVHPARHRARPRPKKNLRAPP